MFSEQPNVNPEAEKTGYPEKVNNIQPIDGTEKCSISFSRIGGKDRWYTIDPFQPKSYDNEGDGDSLYAKISKDGKEDFYLIDGKDINDVGNFVVGFYNDVNKEVVVGGQEYPIAVYAKRRDAAARTRDNSTLYNSIAPRKSSTDLVRYDAYRFCFFDKDANEFITQDIYKYGVLRGEERLWANVIQEDDNLIIDEPESPIYDDGYKVGMNGGKKTFKIWELISLGKIQKAEELKHNGDSEKAKQLARSAVQIIMEKGINNKALAEYLLKVCNDYDLKEKAEVASELLDRVLNERTYYSNLVRKLGAVRELIGSALDQSIIDKKLYELRKKELEDDLARMQASDAITFAKENNMEEELRKNMKKLEDAAIGEISRITSNEDGRGKSPFEQIKMFFDFGISEKNINKFLGREKNEREIINPWKNEKRYDEKDQFSIIEQRTDNIFRWYRHVEEADFEKSTSRLDEYIKDTFDVAEKLGVSRELSVKEAFSEFFERAFWQCLWSQYMFNGEYNENKVKARERETENELKNVIIIAKRLGINKEELLNMINQIKLNKFSEEDFKKSYGDKIDSLMNLIMLTVNEQ